MWCWGRHHQGPPYATPGCVAHPHGVMFRLLVCLATHRHACFSDIAHRVKLVNSQHSRVLGWIANAGAHACFKGHAQKPHLYAFAYTHRHHCLVCHVHALKDTQMGTYALIGAHQRSCKKTCTSTMHIHTCAYVCACAHLICAGVRPEVAAASSATMILATSLSATTVYAGLGAFSKVHEQRLP